MASWWETPQSDAQTAPVIQPVQPAVSSVDSLLASAPAAPPSSLLASMDEYRKARDARETQEAAAVTPAAAPATQQESWVQKIGGATVVPVAETLTQIGPTLYNTADFLTGGYLDEGRRRAQAGIQNALGDDVSWQQIPTMAESAARVKAPIAEFESQGLKEGRQAIGQATGIGDAVGTILTNPSLLTGMISESAPWMLGIAGPAKFAATAAFEGAIAKGATRAVAEEAAKVAATRASIAGNFAISGGTSGLSAQERVYGTSEKDLMANSPEYAQMRAEGLDHRTAQEALARSANLKTTAVSGALGAGATALMGGGIESQIAQRLSGVAGTSKGVIRNVVEGGLREGAEETMQSGGERIGENVGMMSADSRVGLFDDALKDAVVGGLVGAISGGVFGTIEETDRGSQSRTGQAAIDRAAVARAALGVMDEQQLQTARDNAAKALADTPKMPQALRDQLTAAIGHLDADLQSRANGQVLTDYLNNPEAVPDRRLVNTLIGLTDPVRLNAIDDDAVVAQARDLAIGLASNPSLIEQAPEEATQLKDAARAYHRDLTLRQASANIGGAIAANPDIGGALADSVLTAANGNEAQHQTPAYARANLESGQLVRKIQDAQALMRLYDRAADDAKPITQAQREALPTALEVLQAEWDAREVDPEATAARNQGIREREHPKLIAQQQAFGKNAKPKAQKDAVAKMQVADLPLIDTLLAGLQQQATGWANVELEIPASIQNPLNLLSAKRAELVKERAAQRDADVKAGRDSRFPDRAARPEVVTDDQGRQWTRDNLGQWGRVDEDVIDSGVEPPMPPAPNANQLAGPAGVAGLLTQQAPEPETPAATPSGWPSTPQDLTRANLSAPIGQLGGMNRLGFAGALPATIPDAAPPSPVPPSSPEEAARLANQEAARQALVGSTAAPAPTAPTAAAPQLALPSPAPVQQAAHATAPASPVAANQNTPNTAADSLLSQIPGMRGEQDRLEQERPRAKLTQAEVKARQGQRKSGELAITDTTLFPPVADLAAKALADLEAIGQRFDAWMATYGATGALVSYPDGSLHRTIIPYHSTDPIKRYQEALNAALDTAYRQPLRSAPQPAKAPDPAVAARDAQIEAMVAERQAEVATLIEGVNAKREAIRQQALAMKDDPAMDRDVVKALGQQFREGEEHLFWLKNRAFEARDERGGSVNLRARNAKLIPIPDEIKAYAEPAPAPAATGPATQPQPNPENANGLQAEAQAQAALNQNAPPDWYLAGFKSEGEYKTFRERKDDIAEAIAKDVLRVRAEKDRAKRAGKTSKAEHYRDHVASEFGLDPVGYGVFDKMYGYGLQVDLAKVLGFEGERASLQDVKNGALAYINERLAAVESTQPSPVKPTPAPASAENSSLIEQRTIDGDKVWVSAADLANLDRNLLPTYSATGESLGGSATWVIRDDLVSAAPKPAESTAPAEPSPEDRWNTLNAAIREDVLRSIGKPEKSVVGVAKLKWNTLSVSDRAKIQDLWEREANRSAPRTAKAPPAQEDTAPPATEFMATHADGQRRVIPGAALVDLQSPRTPWLAGTDHQFVVHRAFENPTTQYPDRYHVTHLGTGFAIAKPGQVSRTAADAIAVARELLAEAGQKKFETGLAKAIKQQKSAVKRAKAAAAFAKPVVAGAPVAATEPGKAETETDAETTDTADDEVVTGDDLDAAMEAALKGQADQPQEPAVRQVTAIDQLDAVLFAGDIAELPNGKRLQIINQRAMGSRPEDGITEFVLHTTFPSGTKSTAQGSVLNPQTLAEALTEARQAWGDAPNKKTEKPAAAAEPPAATDTPLLKQDWLKARNQALKTSDLTLKNLDFGQVTHLPMVTVSTDPKAVPRWNSVFVSSEDRDAMGVATMSLLLTGKDALGKSASEAAIRGAGREAYRIMLSRREPIADIVRRVGEQDLPGDAVYGAARLYSIAELDSAAQAAGFDTVRAWADSFRAQPVKVTTEAELRAALWDDEARKPVGKAELPDGTIIFLRDTPTGYTVVERRAGSSMGGQIGGTAMDPWGGRTALDRAVKSANLPKEAPKAEKAEASADPNIGRQWESVRGKNEVIALVTVDGKPRYQVRVGENTGSAITELMEIGDLNDEIRRDERRLKERRAYEAKAADNEAQAAEAKRNYLRGYDEAFPLSNFERANLVRALEQPVKRNGNIVTRKALIESIVDEGGASVGIREKQDALISSDGTHILQDVLTQTGMSYARWLIDQKAKTQTAPSATIATPAGPAKATPAGPGVTAITLPVGAAAVPAEKPAEYGANNTLVSTARAEEIRKRLKAKLNQLNAGIDPELLALGTELAAYHLEASARKFVEFAQAMAADLDTTVEKIKPFLRAWYNGARDMMEDSGLDVAAMESPDQVKAALAEMNHPVTAPGSTLAASTTATEENPNDSSDRGEVAENDRNGARGHGSDQVPAPQGQRGTPAVSGAPVSGNARESGNRPGSGVRGDERTGATGTGLRHGSSPDVASASGLESDSQQPPGISGRSDRGVDFRATPAALARTGSWLETAQRNVDIIELAQRLEQEGRKATPEEQQLLARYVGFGASEIRNPLFPTWGAPKGAWADLAERLNAALSAEEMATLKQSTQYAHYTSPTVVQAMWRAMQLMGFSGGQILEPGMGVGHFATLMPDSVYRTSTYSGVEFDALTAKIAGQLLQSQNIFHADYTQQAFPNNFFDLAIGNPPFQGGSSVDYSSGRKTYRFSLHDYFFAKTLDKVRPGGMVAFITSSYTLDKLNDKARKFMADRADLIGAIRLPQTAFAQNAGTSVTTDVIFLRKREPGAEPGGESWMGMTEITTPDGPVLVNEYYARHPEMVLGETRIAGSEDPHFGHIKGLTPGSTVVVTRDPSPAALDGAFQFAVEQLPKGVYSAVRATPEAQKQAVIEREFNPKAQKEGQLYLNDRGALMVRQDGMGVSLQAVAPNLTDADQAWLKSYVRLRDALNQARLSQYQGGHWEADLAALNVEYDRFVQQFGPINAFQTKTRQVEDEDGALIDETRRVYLNKKRLALDVDSTMMMALEEIGSNGDIKKGRFLTDRLINTPLQREVKTLGDALGVSLDVKGRLDLADIAERMQISVDQVIEGLGPLLYQNPGQSGAWEMADAYLSGDVVAKLAEARAIAQSNPAYQRNVEALEKVQPPPLGPMQIRVKLGAAFVPADIVTDFARTVLGETETVVRHDPASGVWTVAGATGKGSRNRRSAADEWGTEDRSPLELLEDILNNKTLVVKKTADGKTFTDPIATAQLIDLAERLRARFSNWVWTDTDHASRLLEIYNTRYNNIAPRVFDGSHLTLPGLSATFKPHPHQLRAVWRIIQTGNTYAAHAVGAGKTFEMIAAGMEQRRLGLIRRPMYVVPNHMLEQFSTEFQQFYPLANIMVADKENFHTDTRRRFMGQVAMNDPDAVIITHSAFGLLKVNEDSVKPLRDEMIADLQDALDASEDRISRSKLEKMLEQAGRQFDRITNREGKDAAVGLEDLGVDFLFVDEAHQFRKVSFTANLAVKGIDPQGSFRAIDLFVKTRILNAQRPGRAFVFASGTPVTNTMGELFTLQRFFDEEGLRRDGLHTFDGWASMFGEAATLPEAGPSGRYEPVTRFARFVNIPELMSRVRQFMDVLTPDQLAGIVTLPELEGNKPNLVVVPPTPELQAYMKNVLEERVRVSKAWKPSREQPGNPDPLINIITDGRLAALDPRFFNPRLPKTIPSKLNAMIDGIIAEYRALQAETFADPETGRPAELPGATQMVFFNVGFGEQIRQSRGFDARAAIMERLAKAKIPAREVAWFQEATTDAQKEEIFRKMRSGELKILFGSAKQMGTGVNAQSRLKVLHYFDPPWYPADVTQPHGRILRQGNQNSSVRIHWYATKGTYDTTMWQMVARKQRFIDQALSGDANVRSLEDISEASQFEMAAALASGDQRIVQLAVLTQEVERLGMLQQAHQSQQITLRSDKRSTESSIEYLKGRLAVTKEAAKLVPEYQLFKQGQVGQRTFTDKQRTELGDALVDRFNELSKTGVTTHDSGPILLGQVNGFEVFYQRNYAISNADLDVRIGKVSMSVESINGSELDVSSSGLITKIVNQINGIHRKQQNQEAELAALHTNLKTISKKLGAPFEYGNELIEKSTERAQLQQTLLDEGQQAASAELAGAIQPDGVVTPPEEAPNTAESTPNITEETPNIADTDRAALIDRIVAKIGAFERNAAINRNGVVNESALNSKLERIRRGLEKLTADELYRQDKNWEETAPRTTSTSADTLRQDRKDGKIDTPALIKGLAGLVVNDNMPMGMLFTRLQAFDDWSESDVAAALRDAGMTPAQLKALGYESVAAPAMAQSETDRAALIERIVAAMRADDPMPKIQAVTQFKGNDGNWYRPNGIPRGVTTTGETRISGYALVNPQTGGLYGNVEPTRKAVEDRWTRNQAVKDGENRRDLEASSAERLQESAAHWLKGDQKFSAATTPATLTAQLKAISSDATVQSLIDNGRLKVVAKQAELPPHAAIPSGQRVAGWVDPKTGVVYLIAENITQAEVDGLLSHEVGVHQSQLALNQPKPQALRLAHGLLRLIGAKGLIGEPAFNDVLAQLERMRSAGNVRVVDAFEAAANAAKKLDQSPALLQEEALAYLAQNHPQLPLIQRLMAMIRAALYRMGFTVNLTEADLHALAKSAVRMAAAERAQPAMNRMDAALQRAAQAPQDVEAQRQYDAVVARYTLPDGSKSPEWMKAPNGQPTKLTERQWVQVRTENFKRWFGGDWEAAELRARILASPIERASTRGLSETGAYKALRDEATALYHGPLVVTNRETNEAIRVEPSGLDNALQHGLSIQKRSVVAVLDKLIENAVFVVRDTVNMRKGIHAIETFAARVTVDGEPFVARLVVREVIDGRRFYDHELSVLESERPTGNSGGSVSSSASRPLPQPSVSLGKRILNEALEVNPASLSKVVDENGEPKILYHGTDQDWSFFDFEKVGQNTKHPTTALGGFLTTDPSVTSIFVRAKHGSPEERAAFAANRKAMMQLAEAAGFKDVIYMRPGSPEREAVHQGGEAAQNDANYREGASVMPFFSNIKNPLEITFDEWSKAADWVSGTSQAGIDAIKERIAQGNHDGLLLKAQPDMVGEYAGDTLVFFSPTQIKSAIGNSGAFSPTNRDIRYSYAGENDGIADKDVIVKTGGTDQQFSIAKPRAWTDGLAPEVDSMADKIGAEPKGWLDRLAEMKGTLATRLRQGLVDRFARLLENDQQRYGRDVVDTDTALSSWVASKMSKSAEGALESVFLHGTLKWEDGALNVSTTGQGLVKALEPVAQAGELNRFWQWIIANRSERLAGEGRENLFTPAEITAGVKLNQGSMADGQDRAKVYQQVFDRYKALQKSVLDVAEQAGLVNAQQRLMWEHDFYLPFYRVMEDSGEVRGPQNGGKLVRQKAFEHLKGGREKLSDPLQNILRNWNHLIDASLKNRAATLALDTAAHLGVAEEVPNALTDKNSVWIMRGGDKVHYNVSDPLTLEAISALNPPLMNGMVMRTMAAFKRALTYGVTLSPAFKAANLLRDSIAALAVSKLDANLLKMAPLRNPVQGFLAVKEGSATQAAMLAGGGAFRFGNLTDGDRESAARRIAGFQADTVLDTPGKIHDLWGLLKSGIHAWERLGDRFENANRAALYQQLRAEGKTHLQASLAARDVLDFAQSGAWPATRFLTSVVPFLNARIQGLDVLYRKGVKPVARALTGQASSGEQQQAARFSAVAMTVAMASILLYLAFKDDDDFKKREQWDRDSYWWFKVGGKAYRIPKPFEVGALGTIAERLVEQVVDQHADGKLFAERMKQMLTQTFSFSAIPQMAQPWIDVYANQDSFTHRPIETLDMERLSPELRRRPNTSAVATGLSQAGLGKAGLSPVQIEHLINGYFGWLGAQALLVGDDLVRPALGLPDKPFRVSEVPVIGDLIQRFSPDGRGSRYVTEFYDQLKQVRQVAADARLFQTLGDTTALQQHIKNHGLELAKARPMEAAARTLADIGRAERMIANDRALSSSEKQTRIDRLDRLKSQLAQNVRAVMQ